MGWLRLDDGFTDHRKIVKLKTDQRRWTWLRVLAYTARFRSPEIPDDIAYTVSTATPKYLEECVEIGLLDRKDDGSLVVHDWSDYQPKDPTKAERQARWRAKNEKSVDAPVDDGVDGDVDKPVDGESVHSRARGRARPVPSRPVSENPAAAEGTQDAPDAAAADELTLEVLNGLDDLGLNGQALELAQSEPARAQAWLRLASAEAQKNPAGYVLAGLKSGEWPSERATKKRAPNPLKRAEGLLKNLAAGGAERRDLERELDDLGITNPDERQRLLEQSLPDEEAA